MIWLIGSGNMAREYIKVLLHLNLPFLVIGRGEESARKLEADFKVSVFRGGLEKFLESSSPKPSETIIATSVETLAEVTIQAIQYGVPKILVEKPLCLFREELMNISNLAKKSRSEIFIAYNRRFYSSVEAVKKIIKSENSISSFNFEFTEWSHVIETLPKPQIVKNRWLIANSSHVIDLAFHLCGYPLELICKQEGSLTWHPTSSRFVGLGKTPQNALFSYHADWSSPGRWGIEILTGNQRLILRPLETLHIQKKASTTIEPYEINDTADKLFKPGLLKQVSAFISNNTKNLCTLDEYGKLFDLCCQIAGYEP